MKKEVSYNKENNLVEHNILQAVKIRPGMYIGSCDTSGVINLIKWLLVSLNALSKEPIRLTLQLNDTCNFKIKIKGANLLPLIEFINPIPSKKWKSGYVFDLRFFMAFMANSTIKVKQEKVTHYFTSKDINYEVKSIEEINDTEQLTIKCTLDNNIFKDLNLNLQLIREEFTQFAYLMPHIKLSFLNKTTKNRTKEVFYFPEGLSEKLQLEIEKQTSTKPAFIFDRKVAIKEYKYHIACCFLDNWTARTYIKTFANDTHLYMGGSLENGIIEGIKEAINFLSNKNITIEKAKERILLLAQVHGEDFSYKYSLKSALDMPVLEKEIKEYITTEFIKIFRDNMELLKQLTEDS